MSKKLKKNAKRSALATFFQGLGNVASSFEAAAATRKDKPADTSMSGVKPASSDCGGCK